MATSSASTWPWKNSFVRTIVRKRRTPPDRINTSMYARCPQRASPQTGASVLVPAPRVVVAIVQTSPWAPFDHTSVTNTAGSTSRSATRRRVSQWGWPVYSRTVTSHATGMTTESVSWTCNRRAISSTSDTASSSPWATVQKLAATTNAASGAAPGLSRWSQTGTATPMPTTAASSTTDRGVRTICSTIRRRRNKRSRPSIDSDTTTGATATPTTPRRRRAGTPAPAAGPDTRPGA